MQYLLRTAISRFTGAALAVLFVAFAPVGPASAATTGSLSGTVTDGATRQPLVGATVTASAPSGRGSATTDGKGFYNIYNLAPDTYTVSITTKGFEDVVISGVTVVQDQAVRIDQSLARSLKTIGRVSARNPSNLVQPNQTADVYNVSPQQLGAAEGVGGHRTLYDVIQTTPGVTSTGYAGRPRIRGSDVGDVSWEYDGIPINDRLTGLFTTNLSVVGTQNLEVYTGGFNAQYGNAAAGIINSVVKRGTNPGFGSFTYTSQFPNSEHDIQAEYGGATRNGKFSWYGSLDYSNSDPVFANGYEPYATAQSLTGRDSVPSTITSRDYVGNLHWKPNDKDDVQFLVQSGNQKIPWDKSLPSTALGVALCHGVVVTPGTGVITNPGASDSGAPCVSANGPTGLQYTPVTQQNANVWYHWSNLGKIQWNHVFNEKLFATARLAENFNQYIFYQPFDCANVGGAIKPGTAYDAAGGTGQCYPKGDPGYQAENSDRRSQMYIGSVDLTFTQNSHSVWYGGISYERDNSAEHYYDYCGCDDAAAGNGAFNLDGSWPNLFLAVDYPLYLPSAYIGTKQTFGKLTLEPGLRWDGETYQIPNRPATAAGPSYANGPYSVSTLSPRFAFTWAVDTSTSVRGSYGVTSSFVPAAYVFNNSPNGITDQDGRHISPYYPGANLQPQINHNVDLSYAHDLRNGVDSFRFSPYYHKADNKLAYTKDYHVNPDGTVTTSKYTLFKTGIANQATGFEFGWNHVVRGDGLNFYASATYTNYWGTVTPGTLAGGTPYGTFVDPVEYAKFHTLVRNPSQPPWTASFTAAYNSGRYHVQPYVNYQVGAPYNVLGNTQYTDPSTGLKATDTQVHYARANYYANLDFGYDVYKLGSRAVTLGLNIRNVFNQRYADVYPVTNGTYPNGPSLGDLGAYGPNAGLPNTLYYYSPDQTPTQYQVYLRTKF